MNSNCYHLHGPNGVKLATQRIKQVLQDKNPQYIIRADIKSFYKSIPHHQLIQDVRRYYDDPKVQLMLERIITNPIETPRGYKNPDHGIALRGPLSQFFSGIYLKPLDDAFDETDVHYFRYQDDILILCQTKRSLERCKQRMMSVLKERCLGLSSKKTRIGCIKKGFHFLGINYLGTQPSDNINVAKALLHSEKQGISAHYLTSMGGNASTEETPEPATIVPHSRTLRKAREQVKLMVMDGVSPRRISSYLHRWATWWVRTSESWIYQDVMIWFINVCWDAPTAAIARNLYYRSIIKTLHSSRLNPAFVTVLPGAH